jgi:hypothetical protein
MKKLHSSVNVRTGVAVAGVSVLFAAGTAIAAPNNIILRQLTNITQGSIEGPKLQLQDGLHLAFVGTGNILNNGTAPDRKNIYIWEEAPDASGSLRQLTNGVGCDSWDAQRPTDTLFSSRPMVIAFTSNCNHDPSVGNADGNDEIFFVEVGSGAFHQVTNTVAPVQNGDPFTSDSGRCMVFRSNGNIGNNIPSNPHYSSEHPGPGYTNPDGSYEVFLYGRIDSTDNFPHNATFTQISNGPSGTTSAKPVIGGYWFARQCQTSAYQSDHDQLGSGLVGQHIYTYQMPASAIELIFAAEIPYGLPPGTYKNSSISQASPFARGPHIVFETDADLWNNGSLGTDIFDFRAFHPRMTQFTNAGAGFTAERAQVSDGGGIITFDSDSEMLSQKHAARNGALPPFNADHNREIYRLKGRRKITQITQTENCENTQTTILDDGNRVGFISTCDLIPGENPNGLPQIFLYALERGEYPLLTNGQCTQANGCCLGKRGEETCYTDLTARKPSISRPNCLERDSCITD